MMVHLSGVTKSYGTFRALAPLDMKVDGEIWGIIGNNGAGKSTLMKMIVGLLPPDKGKIQIDGKRIKRDPETVKKQIGYLPESPMLYPRLTAEELLTYIGEIKGISEVDKEVDHWLKTFGLFEKRKSLVSDLSFGMKKKVGLSSAFLGRPPLLVLDEPFNGLDVATMERLSTIITESSRAGATILISSHLMVYIHRLCQHVLVLKEGVVVGQGSPDILIKEAKADSFHDAFLHFIQGEK
ncbi:MAG: ABC transporter ATP-binding protein [Nitrospiria bacterium]